MTTAELTTSEAKFLYDAVQYLENPSFLQQLANLIGKPLEAILRGLDKIAPDMIDEAVKKALESALSVAIGTIPAPPASAGNVLVLDEDINKTATSVDYVGSRAKRLSIR